MRLTLKGVGIGFSRGPILRDVSLVVERGERVALLGPSGSGKSTLLAIIAGELAPDHGRVTLDAPEAERAEWIVQSAPLLPYRSALDNVALGPLARGIGARHARAIARATLTRLGVPHLAASPAHRLSGGERQRIAVCRALASGASLVLADEPTASLDHEARALVVDALGRAASEGTIMLVATHDPVVAAACDRSYEIVAGTLRLVAPRRLV